MRKLFTYCAVSAATMFGLYIVQPSFSVSANDVKQIYKDTCELCHGPDGKGSEAGKQFGVPNFADPDYQRSRTDDQMKESMTKGTKNPNYVPLGDLGVDLSHLDAFIQLVRGFGG